MKKIFFKRLLIAIITAIVCINLIYINSAVHAATSVNATKIIDLIKEAVSKWYYVLRLLSIAFMLLVLLFIGIKMAISTVASEQAVYKNMLVDWLAGMILVFSIHYFMIAIFAINDSAVAALKPLADKPIEYLTDKEDEYGLEAQVKNGSEVETTLYESARTRAYSLKLTDGFVGMIIYGALVYYAYKFVFMYFKRLINIMILTLVSPVIAASYAINKVVSGKAKVFTSWLSEYVMNVLIQLFHTIIYVSFTATALALSQESLPQVILACVLLSFMLKADKLLRQIFKMSGGKGSLAGNMSDKSLREYGHEMKSMASAMVAGPATKAAMKATYRVATKPARKTAEIAFGAAMVARANYENSDKYQEKKAEKDAKEQEKILDLYDKFAEGKANAEELEALQDEQARLQREHDELEAKQEDLKKEHDELVNEQYMAYVSATSKEEEEEIAEAIRKNEQEQNAIYENEKKQQEVMQKIEEFNQKEQEVMDQFLANYQASGTAKDAFKAGMKNLLDYKKYTEFDKEKGKYVRKKTKREGDESGLAFWHKKKEGIGKTFWENAKLRNMFDLSDGDVDDLKSELKTIKSSILGVMTSIAGFGIIGAHPVIGMGALASSAEVRRNLSERRKNLKNRASSINNGSYKFKAFGTGAQSAIKNEVIEQIRDADRSWLNKKIGKLTRRKRTWELITEDTTAIIRPVRVGSLLLSGVCMGMPVADTMYTVSEAKNGKKVLHNAGSTISGYEEEKIHGRYQMKLKEKFEETKEAIIADNVYDLKNEYEEKFNDFEDDLKKKESNKLQGQLFIELKQSQDNIAVVGNDVMEVKSDDEITKLAKDADKIKSDDKNTNAEVISKINAAINKNSSKLIESSIIRVCSQKGITDIEKATLNNGDIDAVKSNIVGTLEKQGIIKKGEIDIKQTAITSKAVVNVFAKMTQNKKDTNNKLEDKLVETTYLEYMKKENISDVGKLNTGETNDKIKDMVIQKMLSNSSKQSASVIQQISGQNILQNSINLSDSIKYKITEKPKKIRKISSSEISSEIHAKGKKKLLDRQVTRKSNEVKQEMSEAISTDDQTTQMSSSQIEMMMILNELTRQNEEMQKIKHTVPNGKDKNIKGPYINIYDLINNQ